MLHITACGVNLPGNKTVTMRLKLTSSDKEEILQENAYEPHQQLMIQSPLFPSPYVPNNEVYTYKFIGSSNNDFITVTFDDWLISPASEIHVDSANVAGPIYGSSNRPYLISDGPSMTLTFKTGSNSYRGRFPGFKAVAQFYGGREEIPNIKTDCGFDSSTFSGGVIRLGNKADGELRDCIWVLRTPEGFDGVYMKIIRFVSRADRYNSEESLVVNAGSTSVSNQRLKLLPARSILPRYSPQTSQDGFYIRLKGIYYDSHDFEIAFTPYIADCPRSTYNLFKCDNGYCIEEHLICDGYDHCGDESDELMPNCGSSTQAPPLSHQSSTLSVSVIIPMIVSVFLLIVICLLIIFIRRCRKLHSRTYGRDLRNRRGGRGRRRDGNSHMSVTTSSGEHPPSYDEVVHSTPGGCHNMAFSWSNGGQPPSYEEATLAVPGTCPEAGISQTHLSSTSTDYFSTSRVQSHPTRAGVTLDETDFITCSSSSSEDDTDFRSEPTDLPDSSSSDSSMNEGSTFIPDNFGPLNIAEEGQSSSSRQQIKDNDEDNFDSHERVIKFDRGDETVQVVMTSPGPKMDENRSKRQGDNLNNCENQGGERENIFRSRESLLSSLPEHSHTHGGQAGHGSGEARSHRNNRSQAGHGAVENHRGRQDRHRGHRRAQSPPYRRQGEPTEDYIERNASGTSRERSHHHTDPKNNAPQAANETVNPPVPYALVDSEQDNRRNNCRSQESLPILNLPTSRSLRPAGQATQGSRSQSCANLHVPNLREEDKRHSYAGAGDTSLKFADNQGPPIHHFTERAKVHGTARGHTTSSDAQMSVARSRPSSLALSSGVGNLSTLQEISDVDGGSFSQGGQNRNQRGDFTDLGAMRTDSNSLRSYSSQNNIYNQPHPKNFGSSQHLSSDSKSGRSGAVAQSSTQLDDRSSNRTSGDGNTDTAQSPPRANRFAEKTPSSSPPNTLHSSSVSTFSAPQQRNSQSSRSPEDTKSPSAHSPRSAVERLIKSQPSGARVIDPRRGPGNLQKDTHKPPGRIPDDSGLDRSRVTGGINPTPSSFERTEQRRPENTDIQGSRSHHIVTDSTGDDVFV